MDHKAWLWRKKSTDKTIVAADKVDLSLKGHEEEIHTLLNDKAELQNDVKKLNEKLSSVLTECNAKDVLAKKQAKMAQEAITDREEAEAEAVYLKQELEEALQHRVAGEERITHLDAALKECMQQLRFVREEQEQRIHDTMMKVSREYEQSQMILEEKLAQTSKRLAKFVAENTHLTTALLAKEKLIEDLSKQKIQVEAEFNAVMTRLETTEKDNATLKYEVRVLEKELEIRNEEREFIRRTSDAAHKQHLESVKKIAKLESECQRLRVLVRKRLPGPAALAKMKNEVDMLGRESTETRRKRLSSHPFGSMVDSTVDNSPDTASKRIDFLTEQLCTMEEENKTLKETLDKKISELQFSRTIYTRAASKLAEVESQLEKSSKGQKIMEPTRNSVLSYEHSLASISDVGSDDKVSCAESRTSALISELGNLRCGKQRELPSCKTVGASDIDLMDDFVEMEKLAIVSVDKPFGSSHVSPDGANAIVGLLETESIGNSSEVMGREIVPIPDNQSDLGVSNQEIKSSDILIHKVPSWLRDILNLILEQNRVSQRNSHEILEDIRVALADINHPNTCEPVYARECSDHPDTSDSPRVNSTTDANISMGENTNQKVHPDLSKSVCKIAELIEGISLPSMDYGILEPLPENDGDVLSYKSSQTPSGYMVRVFQWKASELGGVLQKVVHACYDVLNKKAGFDKFVEELSTALDWIMNHCFSLQDVSSMKDAIKKHCDWDETRSESEAEAGMISQIAIDKSNSLANQLQESEKIISNLQNELETLKKSKGMIEDQVENQKSIKENLDAQLTAARAELKEARHDFSSLEMELENKNNCCEELEAACLELQLQLESVIKKENPNNELNEENQLRADWEITAASEKLAECQETILNLGKQLKAMASPREAVLCDKVIATPTDIDTTAVAPISTPPTLPKNKIDSTPTDIINTAATVITKPPTLPKNKLINQRSSLLDQMIAEDYAKGNPLAIVPVPSKNRGGGSLWKRLLRKKKVNSTKMHLPFAP